MSDQKGLLTRLGETIDHYHAERHTSLLEQPTARHRGWLRWLSRQMIPNIGTLILVLVLLLTVPSLAAPRFAPEATSTSTISYQGRLADSAGNPLTGYYSLEFRIYDDPVVGAPLWEEFWTGGNSVAVSDGLFNVMLGSINNTLAAAIEGHDVLYLGITVGTDSEMMPRVQLGSVPFAMYAAFASVPDGSITTEKLADGAVTTAKLADDAVSQGGQADASNVVSREGTGYGDLDDMSVTLNTTGGNLLIYFTASCMHSSQGYWLKYRIVVDGTTKVVRQVRSTTSGTSLEIGTPVAIVWLESGLSAGSHTVKIQWAVDTGIGYTSFRTLTAVELKK